MKSSLLIRLAFALLATISITPAAKAFKLVGQGNESCGTWIEDRKSFQPRWLPATSWVVGYLNGVAATTHVDVLHDIDAEGVADWVDRYCIEHPSDKIFEAANALANELTEQQKNHTKK